MTVGVARLEPETNSNSDYVKHGLAMHGRCILKPAPLKRPGNIPFVFTTFRPDPKFGNIYILWSFFESLLLIWLF